MFLIPIYFLKFEVDLQSFIGKTRLNMLFIPKLPVKAESTSLLGLLRIAEAANAKPNC